MKQTVQYLAVGCQDWKEAETISKGGKNFGKHKNWLNVCHKDGMETPIDWKSDAQEWHAINKSSCESSRCEEVLITHPWDETSFDLAKMTEIENWRKNHVFEEVPFVAQLYVSTR